MPAPASGSPDHGQRPHAESAPRITDSVILEKVLRQTLDACQPGDQIPAAEMDALRAVADRYRGRPLKLEPIAVELVAAAIAGLCPANKNTVFWRDLAARVAAILMDDPATTARLDSLWTRLGGGPP